jgi:hypothetical protein
MKPAMSRAFAALVLTLVGASGCTTESFCFSDCNPNGNAGSGNVGGGAGTVIFPDSGTAGGGNAAGGAGTDGGCVPNEICNGRDDNCNGQIDEGFDFTDPLQCGTCDLNCHATLQNVLPSSITCVPPPAAQLGTTPGTCAFTQCAPNYWDANKNPADGCEYYCTANPTGTVTTDVGGNMCGIDDDCDGQIDEDLDFCHDLNNCGACGKTCIVLNGAGRCDSSGANGGACNKDNTKCVVDHCDPGWVDADGSADNGCEYHCTPSGPEICDGKDNDCDGKVDDEDSADLQAAVPDIGQPCQGGDQGICKDPANGGIKKCVNASVTCCDLGSNDVPSPDPSFPSTGLFNGVCTSTDGKHVVRPGDQVEVCNGLDDDCDGVIDDSPKDAGGVCGSALGICSLGINNCVSGVLKCVGATLGTAEVCNGADDDCDGVIDGTVPAGTPQSCTNTSDCASGLVCLPRAPSNAKICVQPPTDVGPQFVCGKPPDAPCVNATGQVVTCGTAGATPVPQPCSAGVIACTSGVKTCSGAVGPVLSIDKCGEDSNCDGVLGGQPDLSNDVANCGACGHDCRTLGAHANWTCSNGTCKLGATKCQSGYIDCDNNPNDCERACTPSGAELCNGADDNCNCKVDEPTGMAVPSPTQVCGVDPSASSPQCTTGVTVSCSAGAWKCTFPAGICTTGNCSTSPDKCDGLDNNCNGVADESFKLPFRTTRYLGLTCYSDDGKPPPGDGACRGQSTFQCNAAGTDTQCPATFQANEKGPETCDGQDNDCDGVVDEAYNDTTGAADGNFVKPDVIPIAANKWIYKYEASRTNASSTTSGSGNGYFTSAPAGTTLDKTVACSVPGKIPWFNVTPQEAAQACTNRGGTLCSLADWQTACKTTAATACTWGYATNCTSPANYTTGPYCNLHGFDFDKSTAYLDDGLLPTGSALLNGCSAKWGTSGVFDITGNLREITANGAAYTLMGGAYDTVAESGAQCDFSFYSVDKTFKLFDTGFRCCFSSNPSP